MSPRRVLLTGASGFVGSHALRALLDRGCQVRALVHQNPVAEPGVETLHADLERPHTLDNICQDVDVLLHVVTRIDSDPERCDAVNARGTEALVSRARAAGVKRMVYVSNAAVYGYAVHCGATEAEVSPAPVTPISRSRLVAERAVLGAGGSVLRPLFVYGKGDMRFVPVLLRAMKRLPFLVDHGRARLSVIAADTLAGAICDLALAPKFAAGVYHANDGQPVAFLEIVRTLRELFGTAVPRRSLPYAPMRWALRLLGSGLLGERRWTASAEHRLFLVTHDHYYDSSRLWRQIGAAPGPPLTVRLQEYAEWYRQFAV